MDSYPDGTNLALRAGLVQLRPNTAELGVGKAESRDAAESPRVVLGSLQSTQAVLAGYERTQQSR